MNALQSDESFDPHILVDPPPSLAPVPEPHTGKKKQKQNQNKTVTNSVGPGYPINILPTVN